MAAERERMTPSSGIGHLSGVVMDVADLERASRFWAGILGGPPPGRFGQYVSFANAGGQVGLGLQQVPEPKNDKGRTHVDIGVSDLDSAAASVLGLGGRHDATVEENGGMFFVMQDPDDNEFCLVRRGAPEPARDAEIPG